MMWFSECRKHKIVFLAPFILIGLLLCLALPYVLRGKPVGGEIFAPDFEAGVELYVVEGHSMVFENHVFQVSPHSVYLVGDESLKNEILRRCGEIRQYRQFDKAGDIMLGTPKKLEFFPHLCLLTDTYSYRIEMVNWENYSGNREGMGWVSHPPGAFWRTGAGN